MRAYSLNSGQVRLYESIVHRILQPLIDLLRVAFRRGQMDALLCKISSQNSGAILLSQHKILTCEGWLEMKSTHIESRHFVTDPVRFKQLLRDLEFEKLKEFEVEDHIFMPKGKEYDLSQQQMKIRVREDKTLLIYRTCKWVNKAKYDRIRISEELAFEDAVGILKNWNFEKTFAFGRTGSRYKKGDIIISLENIDHIGHMIEIEAPSEQSLDRTISELDYISHKIPKSVPALVCDKRTID